MTRIAGIRRTTCEESYSSPVWVVESSPTSSCSPPVILVDVLPSGVETVPYSYTFTASGLAPLSFGSSGIPAGLTLNPATGELSGTAPAAGSYGFDVIVNTACGAATVHPVLLVVEQNQAILTEDLDMIDV